jgi:hypothetical protein
MDGLRIATLLHAPVERGLIYATKQVADFSLSQQV